MKYVWMDVDKAGVLQNVVLGDADTPETEALVDLWRSIFFFVLPVWFIFNDSDK